MEKCGKWNALWELARLKVKIVSWKLRLVQRTTHPRTKVPLLGHLKKRATKTIAASRIGSVSPPARHGASRIRDTEELDNATESRADCKTDRKDITILWPPAWISVVDVRHEEPRERDSRPHERPIVGGIVQQSSDNDGDIDSCRIFRLVNSTKKVRKTYTLCTC